MTWKVSRYAAMDGAVAPTVNLGEASGREEYARWRRDGARGMGAEAAAPIFGYSCDLMRSPAK
jgi:hypothetical protein